MKFVIYAAVVAVAFGAACKVDTISLSLENTVITKAKTAAKGATCVTGTFTAGTAAVLETQAALEAAIKTAKPNDGDAMTAGWVACKTGFAGTIKYKCDATTIKLDGCTAVAAETKKCSADVAAKDKVNAAFGAGTMKGKSASTPCLGAKTIKGRVVTATCTGADTWTPAAGSAAACGTAAFWGTCPIPKCGTAESTATVTCNATSGTESDCGDATAKTNAGFKCAKVDACTEAECDKKDLWSATNSKQTADFCAATAKVAIGGTAAGCTCVKTCKAGTTNKSKNLAGFTCKAIANTQVGWSCPASTGGSGGAGGSSASTLSVFAAFATIFAYLL